MDANVKKSAAYVHGQVVPRIIACFGRGVVDEVVGGSASISIRAMGGDNVLTLSELPVDERSFDPRQQTYYWIPLIYQAFVENPVHGDVAYTVALLGRDFFVVTSERELPLIERSAAVTIRTFLAGRHSNPDPGVVYLRVRRRRARR